MRQMGSADLAGDVRNESLPFYVGASFQTSPSGDVSSNGPLWDKSFYEIWESALTAAN